MGGKNPNWPKLRWGLKDEANTTEKELMVTNNFVSRVRAAGVD